MTVEKFDMFFKKYIKPNLNETEKISVCFWGGEPLINYKVIKYIVNRLNKIGNKDIFRYKIITNGTLITHEIASFLAKNSFVVQVTIDGNKINHDKNRKQLNNNGSYDIIISNLNILNINNVNYNIRTTLTPETGSIKAINDDYIRLGIDNVVWGVVAETSNFKVTSPGNYVVRYADDIFKLYLNKCTEIKSNVEDFIAVFFSNTYRRNCGVSHNKIAVGVDGKLYPCHRFITNKKLAIGSIKEGVTKKINLSSIDICKDCYVCQWKHFCGGRCLYEVMTDKSHSTLENATCLFKQRLFYNSFKYLVDLYRKQRKSFNEIALAYNCNIHLNTISQSNSINSQTIGFEILRKNINLNIIDLKTDGVAYRIDQFDKKYIINVLSMSILDLIDGKRSNSKIAQEISDACQIKMESIKQDIFNEISTFRELGFIEKAHAEQHLKQQ